MAPTAQTVWGFSFVPANIFYVNNTIDVDTFRVACQIVLTKRRADMTATTRFERNGDKFTAYAPNGTKLHIEGNARRPRWAYVSAPGFGMGMLYNCTLRNIGDMRRLFRQLAVAEFVNRAQASS